MTTIHALPSKIHGIVLKPTHAQKIMFTGRRLVQVASGGINPDNANGFRNFALNIHEMDNGDYLATVTYTTKNPAEWAREKTTAIPENGVGMASLNALLDRLATVDAIGLSALMPHGAVLDPSDVEPSDVAHLEGLWQEARDAASTALGIFPVLP
jgi:hypothetical protein